jgi:hypothetical protein
MLSLILSLAFWPGIMIWDSGRQYAQALTGVFDDWHPPLMEAIWRLFIPWLAGPGPMLLLQLALYGAALGALAQRSWRNGRAREAVWIASTGLFPPTALLLATIIKDALMAALLLAAFALISGADGRKFWRIAGALLAVLASCLRFNAFLAALPLLVLAMPARWMQTRGRAALALACATALLLLAMPAANRLLRAEHSGVELSLVIYDLGGITAMSGQDAFPPIAGVTNPVAVNQTCYSTERWDTYSWWVDPVCPIRFETVRAAFASSHRNPEVAWGTQILRHPVAYAGHRLAHWNIDTQFLTRAPVERWIVSASDPNDGNFQVAPNPVNRAVAWAVRALNATPLGWPCCWVALAFALLLLGARLSDNRAMLALAASALLYDLGYGVLSVASELRYYCWPMMATLIALVLFAGCWRRTPAALRPGGAAQFLAITPLVLVSLLGLGWRLAG